jgi:hypothetical protein
MIIHLRLDWVSIQDWSFVLAQALVRDGLFEIGLVWSIVQDGSWWSEIDLLFFKHRLPYSYHLFEVSYLFGISHTIDIDWSRPIIRSRSIFIRDRSFFRVWSVVRGSRSLVQDWARSVNRSRWILMVCKR